MASPLESSIHNLISALNTYSAGKVSTSAKRSALIHGMKSGDKTLVAQMEKEIEASIAETAGIQNAMDMLKAAMANADGKLQKAAAQAKTDEAALAALPVGAAGGALPPITPNTSFVVELKNLCDIVKQRADFYQIEADKLARTMDKDPEMDRILGNELDKAVTLMKSAASGKDISLMDDTIKRWPEIIKRACT